MSDFLLKRVTGIFHWKKKPLITLIYLLLLHNITIYMYKLLAQCESSYPHVLNLFAHSIKSRLLQL